MARTFDDIKQMIEEHKIEMVDFKMVDIHGIFRHVTIPVSYFTEDVLVDGIGFDASNYGYAILEKSDMVFIPDLDTAMVDPFCGCPTLSMTGDAMIIDYPHNRPVAQYPRNIVKAAEQHMKDLGIADTMLILPEFEFYLFNDVAWSVKPNNVSACVDAEQAHWNSDTEGSGVVVPLQAVKNETLASGEPASVVYVKADSAPENMAELMNENPEIPKGFYPVQVEIGISDNYNVQIISGVEEGTEIFTQMISDYYGG